MPPGKVRRNPKFHVRLRGTLNYYCIILRCCRTVEVTERQQQRQKQRKRSGRWTTREYEFRVESRHGALPPTTLRSPAVVAPTLGYSARTEPPSFFNSGLNYATVRLTTTAHHLFEHFPRFGNSSSWVMKAYFWICLLKMWSYAN